MDKKVKIAFTVVGVIALVAILMAIGVDTIELND